MIRYLTGNLFDSSAEALVNTVNTVGVMGKGIALQFKNNFPNNFKVYQTACKQNELKIGGLLVVRDENLILGKRLIINFPTKKHWRQNSDYQYIELGLEALVKAIKEYTIKSIAIPPLGSGNGGLQWNKVKSIMESHLEEVDCDIYIYEPNANVREVLKKERVNLTPARAMLLYMFFRMVREGEFVSEFAGEKICYFLQRFGGEKYFKLAYNAHFYGPYSGKVKHVLNVLNGSYIMGYVGKDKKPFEELNLLMDGEGAVDELINKDEKIKDIVNKTANFLQNFYSPFGLELLSTVDYLAQENNTLDKERIKELLNTWSNRKKTLFSNNRFVEIAVEKLKEASLHSTS